MFRAFRLFLIALFVQAFAEGHPLQLPTSEALYQTYEHWSYASSIISFRKWQVMFAKQFMNFSIDPCEDFYEFACGNFKTLPLEGAKNLGSLMEESIAYMLREMYTDYRRREDSELLTKLKTFYHSCVGSSKQGTGALKDFVLQFADWPLLRNSSSSADFDWLNVTAYATLYDVDALFSIGISSTVDLLPFALFYRYEDIFNPEEVKGKAGLLSIDLSDKDHELEKIADFMKKMYDLRTSDKQGSTQQFELRELTEKIPEIDFLRYLQILRGDIPVSLSETIDLYYPYYFQNLSALIAQTDSRVLANSVLIKLIYEAANLALKMSFDSVDSTCSYYTTSLLGPAVAEVFVDRFFDEDSGDMAVNMLNELRTEGRNVVLESKFLTPDIKQAALEKTENLTKIVGVSDLRRASSSQNEEYSDIDGANFFKSYFNAARLRTQNIHKNMKRSGGHPKPNQFNINAFYSPQREAIIAEPGIFQPPLFHKFGPMHMNYGGIGTVLGHELMHAFDVEGVQFDQEGEAGISKINSTYHSRVDCFKRQYNKIIFKKFKTDDYSDTNIREVLADNEGLKLALRLYKKWLKENEDSTLHGINGIPLTPLQNFFLAFGQSHCAYYTRDVVKYQLIMRHPPASIRVLGALSNTPEFAEAYNCPVGSGMNPENKCKYF